MSKIPASIVIADKVIVAIYAGDMACFCKIGNNFFTWDIATGSIK